MLSMGASSLQITVFLVITSLIALVTYRQVRKGGAPEAGAHESTKSVFLANGGLTWVLVAGSITLSNLSTEQLVGTNGLQMMLIAWWEIAGFFGLMILAFIFVPIYYRNNCTTVTELLERRYEGGSIRTIISFLFLVGNIFIFLPIGLYGGSLFLKSVSGVDWSLFWFVAPMAVAAAIYTVTGGLKAVAVVDTIAGIGLLTIATLVVVLALWAVHFDLSGIPVERLSMFQEGRDVPIPAHTLFTGMVFIQTFYWSTNQNITQKAMAAPSVREAQKGVLAAAAIRILIIPAAVVIPGVVAFKLFGKLGDQTYGHISAHVLPAWMSGAFAAMIAAATIAHTASLMNSSVALYSLDLHDKYIRRVKNFWRLAAITTLVLMVSSIILARTYEATPSITVLVQRLFGLLSMPILSAFVTGLLFRNVDARAAIVGLVYGVAAYALHNFVLYEPGMIYPGQTVYEHFDLPWLHYIDVMLIVLITSVLVALVVNRWVFGHRAVFIYSAAGRRLAAA